MSILPGQISIDDLLSSVSDVRIQEPWKGSEAQILEAAVLEGSHFLNGKIRIYAMMVSGEWLQYRELWIKEEYGSGGFSMRFAPGWFTDYGPGGLRVKNLKRQICYKWRWSQVLREIERQIREDIYLSPDEEKRVERIIWERGCLPYPRARLAYPEDAWEESCGETLPFRTPPEDRHQGALRPRGVRFRKKEASGNAHGKGAVSG